ncbi:MAG: HD domain-containing protein [Gammaproteobacteria bacterium]|nr:HD domain-containing protein [Gammaproteobacteria bacterium]
MSKNSIHQQLESIGASALAGFFINFNSSQQQIEQSLLMLEMSPNEEGLIVELQQGIELIQKSLKDVGLEAIEPMIISLTGLIQQIRLKNLKFETVLSDLILLAIDDIKIVMEKIIDGEDRCVLLTRMPRICESIDAIGTADNISRGAVIKDALLLLDPGIEIIETSITVSDSLVNLFSKNMPDEEELSAYGVEESDDFIFFRALAEPLESRAKYWSGRVHRMLRLALKMNDQAGRPVNPNQLAAAVYMHDAGMALLPLEIINCKDKLTEEQREEIQQHPVVGYELMRYMKSWREASFIVLQHHEQVNGGGYPYGLTDKDICDGAKILSIVDAVDARTHERAHATLLKRPLLRAAIELGQKEGIQFSEKWVNIFKEVFQEVRKINN